MDMSEKMPKKHGVIENKLLERLLRTNAAAVNSFNADLNDCTQSRNKITRYICSEGVRA
jgi:hypothetical protein